MTVTKRKILITAALPYANGPVHLGHLVGYIQADIFARFLRLQGHETYYICGSDVHGTPIMLKAAQIGLDPAVMVAQIHQEQMRDFADFNVKFDIFHTTHSDENRELLALIFSRLREKGDITCKKIQQAFDPIKQIFLPDRYVKGTCPQCKTPDQYGDSCEHCGATYSPNDLIEPRSVISGATPIEKESMHYFFELPHYTKLLKSWTTSGRLQEEVTNKLDEWFKTGLQAWDISRDAPYFGFKIPGEEDKYFYVWLDAPIGYMASFKHLCSKTNLAFDDYWKSDSDAELYHFVGKDIIYFHALFWPALLAGAGFRLPSAIFANGFLTVNGQKMSKSRGTFIKARDYLNYLPADCLRYYFAAKSSSRIEDLDLNLDDFMQRVNSDLVGKLVNIASRCSGFITRLFDGCLATSNPESAMWSDFVGAADQIAHDYEDRELGRVVRRVMELADRTNQYIDDHKPWVLAKDPEAREKLHAVCTFSLNLFRLLVLYLKPILPHLAEQVEDFLNISPLKWSDSQIYLSNHTIKPFQPLLHRIEQETISAMQNTIQEQEKPAAEKSTTVAEKTPATETSTINIDDFAKVDLRIARIVAAEAIPEADKLLKLTLDLGDCGTRTVFAGIKSAYQPEDLVGRLTVMVANLAPRKMRFGMSEGMVLAASGEQPGIFLLSPDSGAVPGMRVK